MDGYVRDAQTPNKGHERSSKALINYGMLSNTRTSIRKTFIGGYEFSFTTGVNGRHMQLYGIQHIHQEISLVCAPNIQTGCGIKTDHCKSFDLATKEIIIDSYLVQ